MPNFKKILFHVFENHPKEGVKLIGEGLPAKKAFALAKRAYAASKWEADIHVVPIPGTLYPDAVLQKLQGKNRQEIQKSYPFSGS